MKHVRITVKPNLTQIERMVFNLQERLQTSVAIDTQTIGYHSDEPHSETKINFWINDSDTFIPEDAKLIIKGYLGEELRPRRHHYLTWKQMIDIYSILMAKED